MRSERVEGTFALSRAPDHFIVSRDNVISTEDASARPFEAFTKPKHEVYFCHENVPRSPYGSESLPRAPTQPSLIYFTTCSIPSLSQHVFNDLFRFQTCAVVDTFDWIRDTLREASVSRKLNCGRRAPSSPPRPFEFTREL